MLGMLDIPEIGGGPVLLEACRGPVIDPGSGVTGAGVSRANGQVLAAPKVDSVNTFEVPNAVAPKPYSAKASGKKLKLKLPPASVIVVALE